MGEKVAKKKKLLTSCFNVYFCIHLLVWSTYVNLIQMKRQKKVISSLDFSHGACVYRLSSHEHLSTKYDFVHSIYFVHFCVIRMYVTHNSLKNIAISYFRYRLSKFIFFPVFVVLILPCYDFSSIEQMYKTEKIRKKVTKISTEAKIEWEISWMIASF